MTPTPYLPGKFVWFEHASDGLSKARAFYESLFGWRVADMPMGGDTYAMLMNGEQGIGGLRAAPPGVPNHWIGYLSVDDVDRRYEAAIAAGARGVMPPIDFTGVGRAAALVDPTGAAFCVWRGLQGDPPDGDVPAGGWVWNELWTPDAKKSLEFYERVFGYTHDSMPMADGATYRILKGTDGAPRAGMTQSAMAGTPSMWLPYVRVADCDATVAKAQQLGARQIVLSPIDIPGVGRIGIVIDALGAAIAMITPAPRGAS